MGAGPQNCAEAGKGERGKTSGEQLLRSKGQQKRATCFALLQNELKSDVAYFTIQESNLSRNISVCVNTDFWLDKITRDSRHAGGYVTCCKTSLPWAGKKPNMYTLLQNKEPLSTFLQQLFGTCNDLVCYKTGLIPGW